MKSIRYALLTAILSLNIGCADKTKTVGGSGLIETTETVISAETSGRVISLNFSEGDRTVPGDTLAIIDPSRLELELASSFAARKVSESNLVTARLQVIDVRRARDYASSERDRLQKLLSSGTTTQQNFDKIDFEYDQAELAYKTAEANVATLEAELERIDAGINRLNRQLEDCYPAADLNGVITEKYVEIGELLTPGKAIAKIARLDTVWVKVYLAAGDFARVKIGDKATIDTESGERQYEGHISWTSDEAEFTPKNVQTEESRANLVYAVKITIPNTDGRLKVGMPVYVTLVEK
ncbi:MAG: HlyD family secretion protein [Candidatus Zixiibacteriota bacterium]